MKQFSTVRDILIRSAEKYPDRAAFLLEGGRDGMREITYSEFRRDTDALIIALKERFNLEGKHIGIMARNSYYWCVSYFAAASLGTAVPIDRDSRSETTADIIRFGDVAAVICDSVCAREINKCTPDTLIICIDSLQSDEAVSFDTLLDYGRARLAEGECVNINRASQEMAVLIFTSGTTGKPKGVMLSHNNIISDLEAVSENVKINEEDRSLSVLPLHHTYEAITMLIMVSKGATVCFSSSYKNLIRDFSVYEPTVLVCVPMLLEKFDRKIRREMQRRGKAGKSRLISLVSGVMSDGSKKKVFSAVHDMFGGRLKKIIVGAAALDKKIAESFEDYGFEVIIGYGLTECSPIVICNSESDRKTDSVGKPLAGVSVKLVDSDSDGVGEIAVRGPMVMRGYYKNKGATDAVLIDGWLHTGDLGYMDSNGYFYITGRIKNVIVTPGGKNVYPEEIEQQILKSPLVNECIVFANESGEICAQLLPDFDELHRKSGKKELSQKDRDLYMNAVIKTVNRRLPPYKRIKKTTVRETPFEKTSTHKIKR